MFHPKVEDGFINHGKDFKSNNAGKKMSEYKSTSFN